MATVALEERRVVPMGDVEVREDSDGFLHFSGYASTFNEPYEVGWFSEQIAPGAFRKTIRDGADVRFLFNHNPDTVMARTTNGTLRLSEDDKGLRVEADLDPSDPDVGRVAAKLRAGNVSQMSFAFQSVKDELDEGVEPPLRTIKEAKLFDVSPVTFPANPNTEAELRRALVASYARSLGVPFSRAAIPAHDTAVVEGDWEGGTMTARCPAEQASLRRLHAWVDSEADPDAKGSYKFPHHEVSEAGRVGAANLNGVRNGLSRLPQADIPDDDRAGVEAHLRNHLDAEEDSITLKPGTYISSGSGLTITSYPLVLSGTVTTSAATTAAELPEPEDHHSERSLSAELAERRYRLNKRKGMT